MTLCVLIYAWQLRGPVCKNIAIWFLCRICIHSVSVSVGWRASWEALQWFHECIIKLDNSSFSFCHVWSDFLSRERETLFFFLSLKHFLQRICVAFGLLFFFVFLFWWTTVLILQHFLTLYLQALDLSASSTVILGRTQMVPLECYSSIFLYIAFKSSFILEDLQVFEYFQQIMHVEEKCSSIIFYIHSDSPYKLLI